LIKIELPQEYSLYSIEKISCLKSQKEVILPPGTALKLKKYEKEDGVMVFYFQVINRYDFI
jgi:hypothetical protein